MYYVYVLQSQKDKRKYTGQTEDLERRLKEHNNGNGLGRSTKNGRPWKLLYFEEFETRREAMRREKYLKSGAGRDELNRIRT
jgi:putative endonuclease